jgi:hypothetical protein
MIDLGILLRIVAIAIFALVGIVLPLSAAVREARRPRDCAPLDIDNQYRKDDRYFAKAFDDLLTGAIGPPPRRAGVYPVHLRENESVEAIAGSFTLGRESVRRRIYDIASDLRIDPDCIVPKELFVGGSAQIGDGVRLRALKAGGGISLGQRVDVERWIDAGGPLAAAQGTRLGARATSLEEIMLGTDVQFGLLSAPRIIVEDGRHEIIAPPTAAAAPARPAADFANGRRSRVRADGALLVDDDFLLPSQAIAVGDVIARGAVNIGSGAVVRGSIHSDASVIIEDGAVVEGSVYSEHELRVGIGAMIGEHAIAAGRAVVSPGARIGTPGRVTTLLADGFLELWPGATICGRVVASRGGITRGQSNS